MKLIKLLLLLLLLPCIFTAKAQQSDYRTIPGILKNDIWGPDWRVLSVSPDGKEVFFYDYNVNHVLKLSEGRFISYPDTSLGLWDFPTPCRVSPDHSLRFSNNPNVDGWRSNLDYAKLPPGEAKAKNYISALITVADNKLQKMYTDTNFIVGANNQNQLFVSSPWLKKDELGGLIGLRLVEPKTGKVLKVLRTDTIFFGGGYYSSHMYFNSTYTALLNFYDISGWPSVYGSTIIRPFGSDSVINTVIGNNFRRYLLSDNDYIYNAADSNLSVFSLHTGKLLYKAVYPTALAKPAYHYRRCLYAQAANGRLYRFDRELATVYEVEVTPDSLRTIKTYPLHIELNKPFLANGAWYEIAAAAGPSLVIAPRLRVDGDLPENAGYVINLPTGKISLRIAPFYNASADQIVKEQEYRRKQDEYYAKQKEKEDAIQKYVLGSSFRKKDGGYSSDEYFVVNYDAAKKLYGFVTRSYVSPQKTFFKNNSNVGHYTFSYLDVRQSYIDEKFTPTGKIYQFCSVCKGSGVTYKTQTRTTGGWEQVNFNVYVFTPYSVTAQWEERVTCGQCFGVGIKEVY